MHDETFYVTKGTVRFHAKDGARIDAKVGDVVSPILLLSFNPL
jgi:quercetin dioxygenase-like cupin family protein